MKGFVLGDVLQWLRFGSFGLRGTEELWASVSSDSENSSSLAVLLDSNAVGS